MSVGKNRINLIIIFAVGLVPLFVAYFVFVFFPTWLPDLTTNEGQLILPPVSNELIGLSLTDSKWSLIIPMGESCDEKCERRFYLARQVHVALGKESNRLKRILITTGTGNTAGVKKMMVKYKGMHKVVLDGDQVVSVLKKVVAFPIMGNFIFLMDPNGNIMMFYSMAKIGKPMLKDLKHLMKISNIG